MKLTRLLSVTSCSQSPLGKWHCHCFIWKLSALPSLQFQRPEGGRVLCAIEQQVMVTP